MQHIASAEQHLSFTVPYRLCTPGTGCRATPEDKDVPAQNGPEAERRGMLAVTVISAALALLVRATYVVAQSNSPFIVGDFVSGDSLLYMELARNIASGHGMSVDGQPTAFVGPGYPLFLAALLKAGLDSFGIGLIQAALGAATTAVIALCAAEIAPVRLRVQWAAVAGVAAAVYPHFVFWTGYILTETLFLLLAAVSVLAALIALRGSARAAALSGAAAGAAALTRPPFLTVAIVVVAWWIIGELRAASPRRIALPLVFAVGTIALLAPWTIRNELELGFPLVATTESGHVFYQGNSRTSNGGSRGYVDTLDFEPLVLPEGLDEVERDAAHFRAAIDDISADPGRAIARWPAKLWNMWRPTYEGASLRNGAITILTYVPVLVLGAVGAMRLARRSLFEATALPLIVLCVWIVVHVVVTGMIRFRLPGELVLLTTLPSGVDGVLVALGRRERR